MMMVVVGTQKGILEQESVYLNYPSLVSYDEKNNNLL